MQPTLTGTRVLLRPFTLGDAPAVQSLAGAREIAATTLNVPHPYKDGMAEAWIETHAPAYVAGRLAAFAIIDPAAQQLVGAMGLTVVPAYARAELGYWVGLPYWNRGYASEAAGMIVRFGFEALGLHRVHAQHFVRNPASGRVMQKLGMRYEGRLREHVRRWERFEDVEQYGMLADEWRDGVLKRGR